MKRGPGQCLSTAMTPDLILKTILNTIIKNEKHGMSDRIRNMNGPIEPNIKPLCDVLNAIPGVRTHAACQGHIYPCSAPYVMFYGPVEVAAALEKHLREDAYSARPALSTLWTVEGMFDGEYRMAFSLKAPHYVRFLWLLYKGIRGLRADLTLLPEMAKEAWP